MKARVCWIFVAIVALSGLSLAQSAQKEGSAREKLIGAWRLVSMDEPGRDGKLTRITDRKGMLLYTRDGHMSVQLMPRLCT